MGICFTKKQKSKESSSSQSKRDVPKDHPYNNSRHDTSTEANPKIAVPIDRSKYVKFVQEPLEQNYEILEKLGEGGSGSVRRARHRTSGVLRAIKSIKKSDVKNLDTLLREVEILKELVKYR